MFLPWGKKTLCAKNAVRVLLLFLSSARPLHLKVCFRTPAQNACFAIGARVLHIAGFGGGSPLGGILLHFLEALDLFSKLS